MPNYTLKYSLMRRMCQHTTVSVKQQFTTCKGIKQQYSIPPKFIKRIISMVVKQSNFKGR